MAKTTEQTKAVTVWEEPQTFAIVSVPAESLELNPELAAEIDQADGNGFEPPKGGIPIVSIRQKDLKNERGQTSQSAGGFKIYDAVSKGNNIEVKDVEGHAGLVLTPVCDQSSRTYWRSLTDTKPACKSIDGINGVGDPGGKCAACPHAQWKPNGDRPECNSEINVLVYDHGMRGAYVLRLGRSGLKPWNNFKAMVNRIKQPLHSFMVNVTTKYETEPSPYFVPMFLLGKQIDLTLFREIKKMRETWHEAFRSAVEVEEHEGGEKINNELPDDVAAFNPDEPFM